MTKAFKQAIALCGLSQSEAARYLEVRPDTIKSWSSGRRNVPDGAWLKLAVLYEMMEVAAENTLDLIAEKQPDQIEFNHTGEHGSWPAPGCLDTIEAMVRMRLKLEED